MQTEILQITGMTSPKCIDSVTRALTAVAGVNDASVSLLRSQVTVQFDEKRVVRPQLESALVNAGYTVSATKPAQDKGSCCGGCCG